MAILLGDAFVRLSANDSQLDKDLASARGKTESWASGLAGNVAKFAGGAVLAGVGALVTGVAAIGTAAFNASSEFDAATKKMQAQLGLTDEAAEDARKAIEGVFKNNFGDSIEDVGNAISAVETAFQRIGGAGGADQLQKATEKALALRDAFDVEVNESTSAAVELMDKFGLSSDEAFDFIAAGFQRGLNSSDDFLESIGEYSTQFANGGADAGQFFSVLETGLQGGVLGTDKAADAFKEFRLRVQDGSKLTADSLKMLGINADEFTGALANGSMSVADAFQVILDKLRETDDPTLRMQAAVGLIGTQFEDLGDSAVAALDLSKTSIDELAGSTEKLNKQYETIPAFFEGLRRRAVVAIAPLGQLMLDAFNEALPSIEAWFTTVEGWVNNFVASSAFEWSPEFKQVKLGDLFEWMQSGDTTRIKIADWFDLTLGTEGIQQLTLGDFFTFISGEGGGTSINLADFVTFIYDNATGNVALTLEDVFTFVSDEKQIIYLEDNIEFSYNKETGRTKINLNDYVTFVYDKETGGVALTLGDVFSFVQAGEKTTINLQDYVQFSWGGGETKKLTLGDFFDFSNKDGVGIAKFDIKDFLFAGMEDATYPITQAQLFDFTEKVKTAAYSLRDFMAWLTFGGEGGDAEKVTQSDLFDLSTPVTPPTKTTLASFFSWITGGDVDTVQVTWGDLFLFDEAGRPTPIKWGLADFFGFGGEGFGGFGGESGKITQKDIFDFSEKPEVSKFALSDFISFGTDEKGNITIESPVWDNFIEKLTWPEALTGFSWNAFIEKLGWPIETIDGFSWGSFVASIVWPTETIDGFSWSTFIDKLTWPLETIASFAWNTFVAPLQWPLDAIRRFSWRDFITGIDFTTWIPEFPGWVAIIQAINPFGKSATTTGSFGEEGGAEDGEDPDDNSIVIPGKSGVFTRLRSGGTTINVTVYHTGDINNGADEEELAYKVARRLAYT